MRVFASLHGSIGVPQMLIRDLHSIETSQLLLSLRRRYLVLPFETPRKLLTYAKLRACTHFGQG
jgi:hypothetical protein